MSAIPAARYASGDVAQSTLGGSVARAARRFGTVDPAVQQRRGVRHGAAAGGDERMYQRIFDVNVKGLFFMMQAVLSRLVAAGRPGAIVNLASQAGRRGEALVAHYCASKAAVISYTQSAALAMAPHRIRVNAISPGVIDTPMWQHVDALFAALRGLAPGAKKVAVGRAVPLGYMGAPSDIAGAAVFLASDDASYITAQTLNVDGGNVMS
jgi:D-sorbitol dehydrogenase (acceptor)